MEHQTDRARSELKTKSDTITNLDNAVKQLTTDRANKQKDLETLKAAYMALAKAWEGEQKKLAQARYDLANKSQSFQDVDDQGRKKLKIMQKDQIIFEKDDLMEAEVAKANRIIKKLNESLSHLVTNQRGLVSELKQVLRIESSEQFSLAEIIGQLKERLK